MGATHQLTDTTTRLLEALKAEGIRRVEIDENGVHYHPRNPYTANVFCDVILYQFSAELATALKSCHYPAFRRPHGLTFGRYDLTGRGAIITVGN